MSPCVSLLRMCVRTEYFSDIAFMSLVSPRVLIQLSEALLMLSGSTAL